MTTAILEHEALSTNSQISECEQAKVALQVGNFDIVQDIAKKMLRENINGHRAYYPIGRIAIETRQADIGVRALQKATQLSPTNAEYWIFGGY